MFHFPEVSTEERIDELKVKNLLALFAIATLLISIPGSFSGFSASAQDSVDDTQNDEQEQTDREKLKEELKKERDLI